ncbi:uncharacterized protein Z518_07336 [Rhinocladiella mackenziei CBS 650.93]|uniref:Rhinocladiella mackenziei CBS 650.93 unplaced genomic scaffold supercont1.5, whole genome shotgun sequence n=1 Tax=Rhinocladiella mackenziei CBS 650.93 TaxID=1442369 RepID=A0A0D2H011_9EURO|nr:uncharacterized protein Z518_07336 [Rhinocladiella mackenziei CBS 650.93]KIX03783.1 hypothetical protein Z518_07336 [Rhinocladiella mackenziei CBS 650.93]
MGEGLATEPDAKPLPYGKSPARKASRPKHLKRTSTAFGGTVPRVLSPTENTAKVEEREKEKEMAASFLQFCAMCEKQIMTPCNSILYCSEACRRKDSVKPLSASNIPSPPRSASTPSSPRPTQPLRTSSASPDFDKHTPVLRIPADRHDHKPDLDPTEWKPKLPHRGASEAFRYLSRFHQTMTASEGGEHVKIDRPRTARHKSTTSMTTTTSTTTPSLGNTPTTASSSFDSISLYDFGLRPLPPRQNPMYSNSAGHSKGIDLVTPHVPPPTSDVIASSVPDHDDTEFWAKKRVVVPGAGSTPRGDGLGALFGRDRAT